MGVKSFKLCPTFCDPMDYSPPGFSVCGILQARILEWVAMPFSRESSQPRERAPGSGTAGRFFTVWTSLVVQLVKNPPAMRETCVRSLGWEDLLEMGKASHSSIMAWRIPWSV